VRRTRRAYRLGRSGTIARRGDIPVPRELCDDGRVLDDRDLAILAVLQEDARATFADVGARVGLSASAVHDRVRKLEQRGVIRAYRAEVDPEAVGLFVTALIEASPLDPRQPDDLPERVREFTEVEDCLSVAGDANYVLKVRTGTTADLEDLIRRLREKAGVRTKTTIALSIPFEGRPLVPGAPATPLSEATGR
jgi:Lrp/AsnC family leucine-responsive transcriptional regulator